MQRGSLLLDRIYPGRVTPRALDFSLRSSQVHLPAAQSQHGSAALAPLWDTHAHSTDDGSQVTVSFLNCTLWMFLGPGPLLQLGERFHLHARCQMEASSEPWAWRGTRGGASPVDPLFGVLWVAPGRWGLCRTAVSATVWTHPWAVKERLPRPEPRTSVCLQELASGWAQDDFQCGLLPNLARCEPPLSGLCEAK